jgi:hypothetical protein
MFAFQTVEVFDLVVLLDLERTKFDYTLRPDYNNPFLEKLENLALFFCATKGLFP